MCNGAFRVPFSIDWVATSLIVLMVLSSCYSANLAYRSSRYGLRLSIVKSVSRAPAVSSFAFQFIQHTNIVAFTVRSLSLLIIARMTRIHPTLFSSAFPLRLVLWYYAFQKRKGWQEFMVQCTIGTMLLWWSCTKCKNVCLYIKAARLMHWATQVEGQIVLNITRDFPFV